MDTYPQLCKSADNTLHIPPPSCRGGFDFSLLFEELLLGILPLAITLTITPWRIWYLFHRPRKVVASRLEWQKLASWITLGIVQLALTVHWALPSSPQTRASVAVNIAITTGSLLLCLLSFAEHRYSLTPSTILNVYLFITLLFDVTKARTLWLLHTRGTNVVIAILTSAVVGVKFVLIVLETIEKRSILKNEYKSYPEEATSGIFNKIFFLWLNPLFIKGFSKQLTIDDLFSLDKHLASKRLHKELETAWSKDKNKVSKSLLLVSLQTFKSTLSAAIAPRAFLVAFNFCQPLLLHRSISFSTEPVSSQTNNVGYGLIGAYMLVYTGMGITMGQYQHLTYRGITMVRGALVSMIYKKACTLHSNDADPSESVTLMSADIERITQGWQTIHDIWGNILEIALAIFLLQRQLGISCLVPVGVSIVALLGSIIGMSFVVSRQAMWLEAIERRISATTSMLSSMTGVKMLGLQSTLAKGIQSLRSEELSISRRFRKLLVWNMALAWLTRIFAPIFTFGAFVGISHKNGQDSSLNTSTVYTALSLFALLADPLLSLVMALMGFIGSVGSFARIQEFLEKESHIDTRNKFLPSHLSFSEKPKDLGLAQSSHSFINESTSSQCSNTAPAPLLQYAVSVQNASFGWDPEKTPSLKDLNIAIPRGSLSIFIGPSGCGKSTLLKGVLGEVPYVRGNIQLSSHEIAYCDQSPWHMNGTIKECITGISGFEESWYLSVINACALAEDFAQLPKGDQTIIGNKGISLSGGQSQRLAIARAVYARKDLVILDDVLSSLDKATESHIFEHLLGAQGLLRSSNTTILLASSSAKRVPFADHIVALDNEGFVIEQGSFPDLELTDGYVSTLALEASKSDGKAILSSHPITNPAGGCNEDSIEIETYGSGSDISVYLYYIQSIGWHPTILFASAISAFIFCISFPSIWVKWWASSNEADPGKHTGFYMGIYAMLGVLGMLSLILGSWQMIIKMVPKSGEYYHTKLLETVLSAPMLFFSTTDSGSILNRFSQDLQLIDMELPVAAINTFATFVLCLCQIIFMGIASKYAAISFPFVIIVVYMIQKMYLRTSRQIRFLDLESKAPLFSHFSDSLSGLATLRAFGWQEAFQETQYKILDRSQRPFYLLFAIQRWLTLTLDMVVAGIAVLLIILVVALRGTISAGYVGVALLNVILFSQSIKLLITFWTNFETHIGSIQRIKAFTEKIASEDLPSENHQIPSDWPSGDIEFKDVSAEYSTSEPVLVNISLSIQSGEKIAICGRTGSGKTSLIMSLFRMIELSAGTITIDGIDITKLPRQGIRSRLNGVPQNPTFIKGSIRLNLDPMGIHTNQAILNALRDVNLLSKVLQNGGLDTDVDNLFLSHGQKQLFCLARAILRPGNVLVLDEATSNVDTKTDEIMQRVIREKFSSHTVITVAHKLDTILDYDKVLVLDAGRVVESGAPYELLSDEASHFSKLYAAGSTPN